MDNFSQNCNVKSLVSKTLGDSITKSRLVKTSMGGFIITVNRYMPFCLNVGGTGGEADLKVNEKTISSLITLRKLHYREVAQGS